MSSDKDVSVERDIGTMPIGNIECVAVDTNVGTSTIFDLSANGNVIGEHGGSGISVLHLVSKPSSKLRSIPIQSSSLV